MRGENPLHHTHMDEHPTRHHHHHHHTTAPPRTLLEAVDAVLPRRRMTGELGTGLGDMRLSMVS